MKGFYSVFVLALFAQFGSKRSLLLVDGQALENAFPLGTIGCLASDVCGPGEVCKDDLLFGSCRNVFTLYRSSSSSSSSSSDPPGRDAFLLNADQIQQLEDAIMSLIQGGFTWQDAFTQCTLQNLLVAFETGLLFTPRLCEEALGASSFLPASRDEAESNEVTSTLQRLFPSAGFGRSSGVGDPYPSVLSSSSSALFPPYSNLERNDIPENLIEAEEEREKEKEEEEEEEDYFSNIIQREIYPRSEAYLTEANPGYNNDDEEEVGYGDMDFLDSKKRDEFVQVHKYFDKSKGQLKRDAYLRSAEDDDPYNVIAAFPQQDIMEEEEDDEEDGGDGDDQGQRYREDPADLFLPLMVEAARGPEDEESGEPGEVFELPPVQDLLPLEEADEDEGEKEEEDEDEEAFPESMAGDEVPEEEEGGEKVLSLSPRDEEVLEQLLEGSVEPEELTAGQQKRLSSIIETMISVLQLKGSAIQDDLQLISTEDSNDLSPPTQLDPSAIDMAGANILDDSGIMITDDDNNNNNDDEGEEEKEPPSSQGPAEEQLTAENDNGDVGIDKKSSDNGGGGEGEGGGKGGEEDGGGGGGGTGEEENTAPGDRDNTAVVKTKYTFIKLDNKLDPRKAETFVTNMTKALHVPAGVASLDQVNGDRVIVKLAPHPQWNSSKLAQEAEENSAALYKNTGLRVVEAGIGKGDATLEVERRNGGHVLLTFVLVGSVAGVVLAVSIIYLLKRHTRSQEKLAQMTASGTVSATPGVGGGVVVGCGDGVNEAASKDYQDLCRQRMQSKASEKPEPLHAASRIGSVTESQVRSPSSRSSTSSWSEEPAATNMDISTGHVVLAYMEDHLKNGDRLGQEWEALAAYQADPSNTTVAGDPANARRNRYTDVLPYDHSRVVLSAATNVSNCDYINASFITDHDPRNPAYICTQGALPHTVADFWQMVWEQGSVVIVMLTRLTENGTAMCHRYWPEEGSDLYHIYEVHLVSEHIWCDDYLVRSFYLKNLQTNETRTVTQFHFLTWPSLSVPPSLKALLDFRRKVNKSFRGGSCPIVLHCNDGCGRSGTYCLIDMVLNRMAKGAKEIDMAATLEHIRDQRMNMVQTKEQFQFALSAVAEEVHAILKALPQ